MTFILDDVGGVSKDDVIKTSNPTPDFDDTRWFVYPEVK